MFDSGQQSNTQPAKMPLLGRVVAAVSIREEPGTGERWESVGPALLEQEAGRRDVSFVRL